MKSILAIISLTLLVFQTGNVWAATPGGDCKVLRAEVNHKNNTARSLQRQMNQCLARTPKKNHHICRSTLPRIKSLFRQANQANRNLSNCLAGQKKKSYSSGTSRPANNLSRTSSSNSHYHNGRQHNHTLPAQGVAHTHNGRDVGSSTASRTVTASNNKPANSSSTRTAQPQQRSNIAGSNSSTGSLYSPKVVKVISATAPPYDEYHIIKSLFLPGKIMLIKSNSQALKKVYERTQSIESFEKKIQKSVDEIFYSKLKGVIVDELPINSQNRRAGRYQKGDFFGQMRSKPCLVKKKQENLMMPCIYGNTHANTKYFPCYINVYGLARNYKEGEVLINTNTNLDGVKVKEYPYFDRRSYADHQTNIVYAGNSGVNMKNAMDNAKHHCKQREGHANMDSPLKCDFKTAINICLGDY